jgi:hypothetical protein
MATSQARPRELSLRAGIENVDRHAAAIEKMLISAGLSVPEEIRRYSLFQAVANAAAKDGIVLCFEIVKGQSFETWRKRHTRTDAERAGTLILRGRNFSVVAVEVSV